VRITFDFRTRRARRDYRGYFTNGVLFTSRDEHVSEQYRKFPGGYHFGEQLCRDGFGDTILAHGLGGNLLVTLPRITEFAGGFHQWVWQTHSALTPMALHTCNVDELLSWSDVTDSMAGNGGVVTLSDTNAGGRHRHDYRVA